MNENDDNEKNIKCYHMHVHPRNDSWAELVLANIYYFLDVSLKKGGGGSLGGAIHYLYGESTNKTGGRVWIAFC
jgi:hypothetical protein